jgi:hypothetical protein
MTRTTAFSQSASFTSRRATSSEGSSRRTLHRFCAGFALLAAVAAGGCGGRGEPLPAAGGRGPGEEMFTPVKMRLHPVFTQVRDWDGDGKPDGIEALVELQDRFGDTLKAAGVVRFELYAYRQFAPDPRGERLTGPFTGRLDTVAEQAAHWSRPERAYLFQLAFPKAREESSYVVEAVFERPGGGRLFDRIVLEGRPKEPRQPRSTTQPLFGGPEPRGPRKEDTTRESASPAIPVSPTSRTSQP